MYYMEVPRRELCVLARARVDVTILFCFGTFYGVFVVLTSPAIRASSDAAVVRTIPNSAFIVWHFVAGLLL